MKKLVLLGMLGVTGFASTAQTKIKDGTVAASSSLPVAGSLLELESNNKGLRMPQVSLTTTTTWTPLLGSGAAATSPGMSVYNTNAGITSSNTNYPASGVGEYYWDGTGWVSKSAATAQNSPVLFSVKRTATQNATDGAYVVCDFTAEDYDKNSNFNLTTNTFTVPANAAGFYQINGFFITTIQAGNQGAYLSLFVDGVFRRYITIGNANAGAGIVASGTIVVPLAAGNVVSIRYMANTASQEFNPQVDIYQLSK